MADHVWHGITKPLALADGAAGVAGVALVSFAALMKKTRLSGDGAAPDWAGAAVA